MDQVRPKTFSAWIIPGIIVPPFVLTKTSGEVMLDVLQCICDMHAIEVYKVTVAKKQVSTRKPIGSTGAVSYIRQMFFYFMKDIYKKEVELQDLADFMGLASHASVVKSIETFHDHIEMGSTIPRTLGNITVREDYKHFNEIVRQWL